MSYAPNTIRSKGSATASASAAARHDDDAADYGDSGYEPTSARPGQKSGAMSPRSRPAGKPYAEERDWARAGMVSVGLALGALLGVGIALLYAPQSGEETRAELRRGARRLRDHAGDVWSDFGDDVRWVTHRGRKRVRRGVRRGGWVAEDVVDAGRRRLR